MIKQQTASLEGENRRLTGRGESKWTYTGGKNQRSQIQVRLLVPKHINKSNRISKMLTAVRRDLKMCRGDATV